MKLYGTMGPACATKEILMDMLREGICGMRLNLSHVSLEESREKIAAYRAACEELGAEMDLMIDLQGPEARTGFLKKPIKVFPGDLAVLRARNHEEEHPVVRVGPRVLEKVEKGDIIDLQDGKIRFEVIEELEETEYPQRVLDEIEERRNAGEEIDEQELAGWRKRFLLRTIYGGIVSGQKNVRVEGKELRGEAVAPMDRVNLDLAGELGVTSIMQPFVRSGDDLRAVRAELEARNLSCRIFAKIESKTGLNNLQSIMEEADVVVIARGDLGTAVEPWELPRMQKEIAEKCRNAGKPFMVVTHMLQSMTMHPTATRAEALDIFNAVLDGADYLMLTAETSIGKYPVEACRMLSRTAKEAENYLQSRP
ncbi:MAG: pyruvate kinase [Clostridia bacterium]|nr:pyruvate kinase [Clostridia bacterium]